MGRPPKYEPLVEHLQALPVQQRFVTLSFTQLEALLGFALTQTARTQTGFWRGSDSARANWLRAGFSARLDSTGRTVTFIRQRQTG